MVGDAAQALRVAFAGVEVGDWVDPLGETRDVSVRLHPADRVDASNIEHLPIDRKSTRLNSSHRSLSRMPSSA